MGVMQRYLVLLVLSSPTTSYRQSSQQIDAKIGSSIELRCSSKEEFTSCTVFAPNDETYNVGSGGYGNPRVESLAEEDVDTSRVCGIHIKEVAEEDEGSWRCEIQFGRGDESTKVIRTTYLQIINSDDSEEGYVTNRECACNGKADPIGYGRNCTDGSQGKGRWCYVNKNACEDQEEDHGKFFSYAACEECSCNGYVNKKGTGGECTDGPMGRWCYVNKSACKDAEDFHGIYFSFSPCKGDGKNNSKSTTAAKGKFEGIVISGGYGGFLSPKKLSTTELFNPLSGKTCSLKPLPVPLRHHSLDKLEDGSLIACGGYPNKKTCDKFEGRGPHGAWTHYSTLLHYRYAHTTLVSRGKILLMGGRYTGKTSWRSGAVNAGKTTELVGGEEHYNLQQKAAYGCAIKDGSFILTGGWWSGNNLKTVTRYNIEGFLESMPPLITARYGHGCGSFINQHSKKVYVVTGGHGDPGNLRSTELLYTTTRKWRAGQDLPRTLQYFASVSFRNSVLIFGGYCGTCSKEDIYRSEILSLNSSGTWQQIGNLNERRSECAASLFETTEELNTSECD